MASGANFTLDTRVMDQMIDDEAARDLFIREVGTEMVSDMQLSMLESPATGRAYRRGGRTHIASSPGNPPRVDMGTLWASLKLRKIRPKAYAIETNVRHGLETEVGIGMAARPWMRPVFIAWNLKLADEARRFFERRYR